MPRVVHLRLSDDSLYTAMRLLQSQEVPLDNLALATIVRRVFEGTMNGYAKKNNIEIPGNCSLILDSLVNKDEAFSIDTPFVDTITERPLISEEMRAHLERALSQSSNIPPREDIFNPTVEKEEKVLPPPPWEQAGVLTIEQLKEISPLDALMNSAISHKDEPLLRAIQIVYSDEKVEFWGEDAIQDKVSAVLKITRKYFQVEEVT